MSLQALTLMQKGVEAELKAQSELLDKLEANTSDSKDKEKHHEVTSHFKLTRTRTTEGEITTSNDSAKTETIVNEKTTKKHKRRLCSCFGKANPRD
jgi:hypothetical protein